jgi:hypothetical protein
MARKKLPTGETRLPKPRRASTRHLSSTTVSFAVNLDPAESRFAPLPIDELERLSVPLKPLIELTGQMDENAAPTPS